MVRMGAPRLLDMVRWSREELARCSEEPLMEAMQSVLLVGASGRTVARMLLERRGAPLLLGRPSRVSEDLRVGPEGPLGSGAVPARLWEVFWTFDSMRLRSSSRGSGC